MLDIDQIVVTVIICRVICSYNCTKLRLMTQNVPQLAYEMFRFSGRAFSISLFYLISLPVVSF